jgi:hypothetical protein
MTKSFEGKQDVLLDALTHLRAAIEILDQVDAPAHIAAHVDLAVNQINDVMALAERESPKSSDGPVRAF